MDRTERVSLFVETIWEWYARHKRTLPWRDLEDLSPDARAYRVLVSEIMLQQTQVSRCIGAFKRFLDAFPIEEDLARASNREVLMAWRGMGYNSRALRLRDAAKEISQKFVGEGYPSPTNFFPKEMEALLAIPGVGHYTAAAIRNFAFNLPTPCLDTNIRRVLHRTFVGPENPDGTWKKDDGYLLKIAGEVLSCALGKKYDVQSAKYEAPSYLALRPSPFRRSAAEWHAALMDFGSLVQTKRNPKWEICPLTERGLMKTTPKVFRVTLRSAAEDPSRRSVLRTSLLRVTRRRVSKREPGRMVGSRFIPNRIFRGKIVEALRDQPRGMTLPALGREICLDWNPKMHERWIKELLGKLQSDRLVRVRENRYVLG